jgi:CO dehydrogenase nickel-insertion accessory protein CooC1
MSQEYFWFRNPKSRPMNEKALAGLRVGVFGKGGAGKSTVTVLLALGLCKEGYRLVVLDADSTNLGLSEALGAGVPPSPLLEHFGGMVFSGGTVTCPVDDPTPLPDSDLDLDELSHRFQAETSEGIRLLVGGKIGGLGPGAGCDGPVAKIARDLRVREGGERPLLLVDFKAGFEDSARGVITGLDWILVVVDPTTAGLQMAVHLQRMYGDLRNGVPPATAHLDEPALVEAALRQYEESRARGVASILNRVPDADTEAYLRGKLGALGGPPVLGTIPEDRTLQTQWLRGEELAAPALSERIRSLVLALEGLAASSTAPAQG